jgi:hypothetical protein
MVHELGFRVRKSGMELSPYLLERLDNMGRVTATRPASLEEWTLFCLALRSL